MECRIASLIDGAPAPTAHNNRHRQNGVHSRARTWSAPAVPTGPRSCAHRHIQRGTDRMVCTHARSQSAHMGHARRSQWMHEPPRAAYRAEQAAPPRSQMASCRRTQQSLVGRAIQALPECQLHEAGSSYAPLTSLRITGRRLNPELTVNGVCSD